MLIIPAIDIIGGKTVRLTKGNYDRITTYDADPCDMVKRYIDYGLTRIHAVDLDGARASSPVNLNILEKLASINGAYIEWGGGLKSTESARQAINSGASFLCAGSLAVWNESIFSEWLQLFGHERIILGADVRNGKISVNGWTEDTHLTIDNLFDKFLPYGLSQAVVTDISRDGMLEGINIKFYTDLQSTYPDIDITVSGGIASVNDIQICADNSLRRVIVGKAIYENRISLKDLQDINKHSV